MFAFMRYSISHRYQVIQRAWPIIIANASVPLLGLVDTAVIGQNGSAISIGALAISNLVFNFIYWAFGFFRMSTTGFVAQARGAGDISEAQAVFVRSQTLAFMCGGALVIMQTILNYGAFTILQASDEVELLAQQYFSIRIWGAPATLALYGVMGVCIGFGKTKLLLLIQLGMNVTNIVLDVIFVMWLDLGVKGIAAGTLIAEWSALTAASILVYRLIFRPYCLSRGLFSPTYFSRTSLLKFFQVNSDLFVRTLFLLAAFAWFTNASAQHGNVVLASSHILLLLISFSAFFLDGFAFVAEEGVGSAIGARDRQAASKIIYLTSEMAGITALALGLCAFLFGRYGLFLLTSSPAIDAQTQLLLFWAVLYIMVSVAAFQLDGLFIGATLSKPMRNASAISFVVFITFSDLILLDYGPHGLWASFVIFVIARSLCLSFYLPQLAMRFK